MQKTISGKSNRRKGKAYRAQKIKKIKRHHRLLLKRQRRNR